MNLEASSPGQGRLHWVCLLAGTVPRRQRASYGKRQGAWECPHMSLTVSPGCNPAPPPKLMQPNQSPIGLGVQLLTAINIRLWEQNSWICRDSYSNLSIPLLTLKAHIFLTYIVLQEVHGKKWCRKSFEIHEVSSYIFMNFVRIFYIYIFQCFN